MRRELEARHRDVAHALNASGDNHLGVAEHNALRRISDGLQAGGTKAVDRDRRHGHGKARIQRHRAGEVQPLLAFGHRAADDDVLDITFVESRYAPYGFFKYGFA